MGEYVFKDGYFFSNGKYLYDLKVYQHIEFESYLNSLLDEHIQIVILKF